MAKVKMLTPLAGPSGSAKAGAEWTCTDAEASALVKGGYATHVAAEKPAPPTAPDTADEDPKSPPEGDSAGKKKTKKGGA